MSADLATVLAEATPTPDPGAGPPKARKPRSAEKFRDRARILVRRAQVMAVVVGERLRDDPSPSAVAESVEDMWAVSHLLRTTLDPNGTNEEVDETGGLIR
jgi:hypothetical protein